MRVSGPLCEGLCFNGAALFRARIDASLASLPPIEQLQASVGGFLALVEENSVAYRNLISSAAAVPEIRELIETRDFISADGFGITAACRRYLLPLIGGEGYPPYRNGLPAYVTLKGASVPKRLRTPFVI